MRTVTENFAKATAPIKKPYSMGQNARPVSVKYHKPQPKPTQRSPESQPKSPKRQAKEPEKKPIVPQKRTMMDEWGDALKSIADDFRTLMGGRKG